MRYEIEQAFSQGYQPNEIVVVTGSYHVEGLKSIDPMTEEERKSLPRVPTNSTLILVMGLAIKPQLIIPSYGKNCAENSRD